MSYDLQSAVGVADEEIRKRQLLTSLLCERLTDQKFSVMSDLRVPLTE